MITTTEKACTKLEEMFTHVDSFGADVSLQNGITGEVIKVDSASLFAGMQAGLIMATSIIEQRKPDEAYYDRALITGIETASKLFVRRIERKWDEKAAAIAEQIKQEEQDNA